VSHTSTSVEHGAITKVVRRFLPFLIVCYFVSYLDKVNVGFAALSMNHALGLSSSQFGLGAGLFFISYCIFEVPSNLALARFGARRWLARIMITWGLISAATAFVTSANWFYGARLILGASEAGFFPGIIFFLTLWFPARYRARIIGYFMIAVPLSSLIGAPISGALLHVEALGLAGWQWMFLIEAVPAVLLGVAMLFWLTDRPTDASWLSVEERQWIAGELHQDATVEAHEKMDIILKAFVNPRLLALVVVYFGAVAIHTAMSFWLPQIVKGFGLTNMETGFVAAIPYLFGACTMVYWGRHSDRCAERKWHGALGLALATVGFGASAIIDVPLGKLIALCIAAAGAFAVLPVFWTLPSTVLGKRAAAGGIAYVNCLGALAGLFAPWLIGVVKDETGSFSGGLLSVAALSLLSLFVLIALPLDSVRKGEHLQSASET